jgi:hypothetical protein
MLRMAIAIHCDREAWLPSGDNIAAIVRPAWTIPIAAACAIGSRRAMRAAMYPPDATHISP